MLESALLGLESFARQNCLTLPVEYRLAFRELGLSIGLRAAEKMKALILEKPEHLDNKDLLDSQVEILMGYIRLIKIIENTWLERKNRKAASWTEHLDMNMVMLATSLAPDGYLAYD